MYGSTLGIRIYWFSQKMHFFLDETASVQLACGNEWNYEKNRGYTGKEAKEVGLLCRKSVLRDVFHLWQDNKDSVHTNLYYSLLRVSLGGLNSVDTKEIIFRGAVLNLFLFTVSFVFFFLLMKLLFPDYPFLQATSTFCAFLSTAAISNTMYLREYQMQETLFIVFCYFFFKTFDIKKYAIRNDRLRVNIKLLALLSLVTAFTLLAGYYAIVFVGLFGLYAIYYKRGKEDRPEILFYAAVLCLAVVFAQIFYLKYLYGYFSVRTAEEGRTVTNHLFSQGMLLENIRSSLDWFRLLVWYYFFTYPVIAICALCLLFVIIYRRRNFFVQNRALAIFAVAVAYAVIILFLAPWKKLRYVAPVFPFFMIFPAALIYSIGKRKISALIMLLLCLFFSLYALKKKNIDHLFSLDVYAFRNDPAVPVFIFNNTQWKYRELVHWFNDKQIYYFNTPGAFDLSNNGELYFVADTTPGVMDNMKLYIQNIEAVERRFSWDFFVGGKVRLRKQ